MYFQLRQTSSDDFSIPYLRTKFVSTEAITSSIKLSSLRDRLPN